MATTATVTVVGADPARTADLGLDEIRRLESLWSRFIDHSDISRLNRADGSAVEVAPETVSLLTQMRAAHRATRGSFDPTRLALQIAAGDSTSLDGSPLPQHDRSRPDTTDGQWFELASPTVVVPRRGIIFDAGGLGKGMAADMVAALMLSHGADAACVNIGGDLRAVSREGFTFDWPIVIGSPRNIPTPEETVSIRRGALATSDVAARTRADGSTPVHIMDRHGPVDGAAVAATVIAGTAAWAEAWTKHLLVVEPGEALGDIDSVGLAARVVLRDGTVERSRLWSEFRS